MALIYENIIRRMSLEEKALMMSGKNVWQTKDFPEYGIPSMMLSDGPHGMRTQPLGEGDHLGLQESMPATCFPTASTIANSWNESLGEEIGQALAKEAISMGVNVVLGPGLNIKRSPLCGRNFEYFSEDPYLSGKMAAAYIRGIQSYGIAACPKHFAVNSQELRRMAMNAVVDERTMREIYLTGFEIAVKEGGAKAIMSSYNQINGEYANENKYLLQDILVDEWGFEGFVVSDWGASNDHAYGVKNGSHLQMPGTGRSGQRELLEAIQMGILTEEELDQRLDKLLEIIFQTQINGTEVGYDVEEHHALAKKAALEGIVLLKNEDNILPLKKKTKIAVVGDFAKTPRYQGAGSSLVNPTKEPESILNRIEDTELHMVSYAQGYVRGSVYKPQIVEDALKAASEADVILVFAGLDEVSEAEGLDRTHMRMPDMQNDLIEALASKYENVIVILSSGSAVEMPWADKVKGIVQGSLGGQAGASAMLDVLTGKFNPCGRLNETYPLFYDDTPAMSYCPGKERNSEYRESIYVGYRYYSTVGKRVRFPFGYGLSYTQFSYKDIKISDREVKFTVKNTGNKDGVEIAQMYVQKESDTVFRPARELKGFKRIELKAGQEKEVVIPFDDKTFRFFDVRTNGWEIEDGVYHILIGKNAEDTQISAEIVKHSDVKHGPYNKELLLSYFSGEIEDVSDQEYECLYGMELPDGSWNGKIDINDAFCQLYYAKGVVAKLAYHIIKWSLDRSLKKGKPDLNLLFIFNMPIRGIARMTGGAINMKMAYAITEIANGHLLKGVGHFVSGYFKK